MAACRESEDRKRLLVIYRGSIAAGLMKKTVLSIIWRMGGFILRIAKGIMVISDFSQIILLDKRSKYG